MRERHEENSPSPSRDGLSNVMRKCVIDSSTAVGRDLNKLFVGFLQREFGEDAFHVERSVVNAPSQSAQVAA